MKSTNTKLRLIGICAFGLLSGCASTPASTDNTIARGELTDDSMDVLFATEFPVQSEQEALLRADQATKEGDTDRALFFLVRALQFRPGNVPLLVRIGQAQMQRQNLVFAKRAFVMALHYEPDHAVALEGVGLIYSSQGQDERAVACLHQAVDNDPGLWRAHNALGIYADKAGDFPTAQRHYDAALATNPDAAYVLNNRGYSKYLAGDMQGAKLDFYEAARNRGFLPAWANLGMIYAEGGQYRDAIKSYKLVMSEASAFNNAGHAAIENGDFDEAEQYLTEAIRLSPKYFPSAEENMALLRERKQYEADNVTQADSG